MEYIKHVWDAIVGKKSVVGPLKDNARIMQTLREWTIGAGSDGLAVSTPYAKSVWVYSAVNAISQNLASAPFIMYDNTKGKKQKAEEDTPLVKLFLDPNRYANSILLMQGTAVYLCLNGEAFWLMPRDNITEIPKEIWCLDPVRFTPYLEGNPNSPIWNGVWEYNDGRQKQLFAPWEVMHFKFINPYNDIRGLSPLEAAKLGVSQDYWTSKYNENFFKNGAAIGGFISVKEGLSKEQFDRILGQFNDRHQGVSKAHRIALIDGDAKFQEAKMSQRDMEFISLKNVTRGEILAAFMVNEVILGNYAQIQCFHPDTEVMTDKGFIPVEQIKVGDKIASMNPETGLMEFQPTTKIYDYDYDGIMYTQKKGTVKGKPQTAIKLDYMVTPEHKMFGKERKWARHNDYTSNDFIFKKISDIKEDYKFMSPRNGIWDIGEIVEEYSIEKQNYGENESLQGRKGVTFPITSWLKFLGWFISEGCYRKNGTWDIAISQKKEEGIKQIREDLKDFPYDIHEYESSTHGITFIVNGKDLFNYLLKNIGGYCYEKRIPRDILNLHSSLLIYLFDAIMAGDGCYIEKEDRYQFSTTSKQLAEDVYELALKIGRIPTLKGGEEGILKVDSYSNKRMPQWLVTISAKKQNIRLTSINPIEVSYKGKVFCFEVPPNHNVLTRYNGKSLIISQSYEGIKEARRAFWEECLIPKMKLIEETLRSNFFSKLSGNFIGEFDLSSVEALREDYNIKVTMAKVLNEIGFTANEINKRLDLGFKDKPWRDKWWIRTGTIPADFVTEESVLTNTSIATTTSTNTSKPKEDNTSTPKEDKKPTKNQDDTILFRFTTRQKIIEDQFTKKLKRFFFEQRTRIIKNISDNKGTLDFDEEIKKIKSYLKTLYSIAASEGIDLLKEEFDFEMDNIEQITGKFLEEKLNKNSIKIIDTIKAHLTYIIKDSTDNNYKTNELIDTIKVYYNKLNNRITTIAKTETNSVMNGIRYKILEDLNKYIKIYIKWISSINSRDTHKNLNGKIVKLGDSFLNEYTLKYPTDPKAGSENIINCMCYFTVVKIDKI